MSGNAVEALTALLVLAWLATQVRLLVRSRQVNPFLVMELAPLAILALFYVILACDLAPIAGDIDLRLAIFRPAFAGLVFLHTCYLLNGNIDALLRQILQWIHNPSTH
jgi:hypothetical protein